MFQRFKFITCLFLIQLFFIQSVSAASSTGLKKMIDEFNYTVNVEWDQQDQQFIIDQKEKFLKQVNALLDSGVEPEDLIAEVKESLNKQSSIEKFDFIVAQYEAQVLQPSDLINEIKLLAIDDAANGTSWMPTAGDVVMFVAPIVVFIAIAALMMAIFPVGNGTVSGDNSGVYYEPYCPYYCLWENQYMFGYYDRYNLPPECYMCSADQLYW